MYEYNANNSNDTNKSVSLGVKSRRREYNNLKAKLC